MSLQKSEDAPHTLAIKPVAPANPNKGAIAPTNGTKSPIINIPTAPKSVQSENDVLFV